MAEIEVTKAMVRAGVDAGKLIHSDSMAESRLADIYRAMRASEPTRMDAESRRLAALEIAVRLGPSQKDLVPLARATEIYLRGENTEVVSPNVTEVLTTPDLRKEIWRQFANDLTQFCRSHGVMLWTGLAASPINATLVDSEESFHYEVDPQEGGRSAIIRRVLGR